MKAKKVGFPQMATIHSLPNPHGYGRRRPVADAAAVAACSAPRGDILAMCIIIIIVSIPSALVCAASPPPRHRRL